jgi:hypothetical protein
MRRAAASRMWVRHRSVLIVPPEGGLESQCDSRKRLCFIHVTIKNGFWFYPKRYIIES